MYLILDIKVIRLDHNQHNLIPKFATIVADAICQALVLTENVIRFNSDGSKMVDINNWSILS